MAWTGVAIALCVGVGHALLARHLPAPARAAEPEVQGREWMRVSLPLLLVSGMRLLLGQADILLVGVLIGTTEAGIYTAASRLSHLITFGQNAANGIVAPMISELHSQGEKAKLQRLVTLSSWASTAFALAAAALLVLGGKLLLSLFGKDFVGSWTVLAILAAGQVVNAASGPVGYLLNMTGHQDANARILAWTVGLNIALAIPAILLWGAAGASAATGLLIAIKNLWTWWEVRRRLGINSSIVSLARGA
jgi:O-antigen/teichoic acid export membrane protein